MQDFEQHPLSKIYPSMSDETFASLCTSIKKTGFDTHHKIVLYENTVLDGWHRYKACIEVHVDPEFRVFVGDLDDAVQFVQRENFNRRDLTSSDRAYITASMKELISLIQKDAKKRQGTRTDLDNPTLTKQLDNVDKHTKQTDSIAASEMGTNRQYVSDARKLMKESPEVFDTAREYSITVPDAKKIAKLEPTTQAKVIEKIKTSPKIKVTTIVHSAKMEEIKQDVAAQTTNDPTRPQIDCATYSEWLPQQQQCDLLLTDPPYTTDIDDIAAFAEDWLPQALAKVKSTGRAYVFIGAYPDEIGAYLTAAKESNMVLANILVWTYRNTLGPSPTHDYKLNWQAILYFRGDDAPKLNSPLMTEQFSVQDINAPDGRFGEGRYHKWQKPTEIAERLIRHSTKKGDVVMDCFVGTGTFMLAAAHLGRIPIGCDIDGEMLQVANSRGCDVDGI